MPVAIDEMLKPSETAVLVSECQEGIIGEKGGLPGLRQSVLDSGMLPRLAKLLECARTVGAQVVHCTVQGRPASRVGSGFRRFRGGDGGGAASSTGPGPIVQELTPHPSDLVSQRAYGMTAFYESGLHDELRAMGIRTVVPTGVSLNIAVNGMTIEAVNRGYTVVLPTDCAASDPPEYAEALIRYTLRNMAVLTSAERIAQAWGVEWTGD